MPIESSSLHPFGQAWAARDIDRLLPQLAHDVVYHSPILGNPGFDGRDSVATIFKIAFEVFKHDQYTHEFGNERSHLFVAESRISDRTIQTTMLLEFDDEGKIRDITMMARPVAAVALLAQELAEAAAGLGDSAVLSGESKSLSEAATAFEVTAARVIRDLNSSTAGTLDHA